MIIRNNTYLTIIMKIKVLKYIIKKIRISFKKLRGFVLEDISVTRNIYAITLEFIYAKKNRYVILFRFFYCFFFFLVYHKYIFIGVVCLIV